MTQARVKAYRSGLLAETLAATMFRLKGYRILARRYRTPVGEIDIVALRHKHLVFVEVKRRRSAEDAAWSIRRGSGGASCAQRNIGWPATQHSITTTSP